MPPNLLVTFYFAMLVALPMKVYKTNLMTSDLFPVVMKSFKTAALIVGATHKHASDDLPHPVQDKCHVNFNIKRFCLNRGCGTTAG